MRFNRTVIIMFFLAVLIALGLQILNELKRPNQQQDLSYPDAIKVILNRKSVRHYREMPVNSEQLDIILKTGMAAPTAMDKRPWAFVAVTEREMLKKMAAGLQYGKMIETAGAAIVVCGIPAKSLPGELQEFWIQDCSAASENMLLAAEAINLGAVWVGLYPVRENTDFIRNILGIPGDVIPLCALSIGHPAGDEQPKNKYDPQNIHYNRW